MVPDFFNGLLVLRTHEFWICQIKQTVERTVGRQSPKRTWYECLMFLMSLIATVYADAIY